MSKKLKYKITSEVRLGSDPTNNAIKSVGEQLRPEDGHIYAGSIAIHIYTHPFTGSIKIATQDCLNDNVNALTANYALQQGAAAIAKQYGHTPPTVRQDVLRKEE